MPYSHETKQELKQRMIELMRSSTKPLSAVEINNALDTIAHEVLRELEQEGLIVWVEAKKGWCAK